MKLDLGCGPDRLDGFTRVDFDGTFGPDVTMDFNKDSLVDKFGEKKVDEIRASHIIEHIEDPYKFLTECALILKPGGRLQVLVPHYTSSTAYKGHPQHNHLFAIDHMSFYRHLFDYTTRLYWMKKGQKSRYAVVKNMITMPLNFLANVHLRFCERFWIYYVGGFEEIEWMCIRK